MFLVFWSQFYYRRMLFITINVNRSCFVSRWWLLVVYGAERLGVCVCAHRTVTCDRFVPATSEQTSIQTKSQGPWLIHLCNYCKGFMSKHIISKFSTLFQLFEHVCVCVSVNNLLTCKSVTNICYRQIRYQSIQYEEGKKRIFPIYFLTCFMFFVNNIIFVLLLKWNSKR
jgi:hypothetical protein